MKSLSERKRKPDREGEDECGGRKQRLRVLQQVEGHAPLLARAKAVSAGSRGQGCSRAAGMASPPSTAVGQGGVGGLAPASSRHLPLGSSSRPPSALLAPPGSVGRWGQWVETLMATNGRSIRLGRKGGRRREEWRQSCRAQTFIWRRRRNKRRRRGEGSKRKEGRGVSISITSVGFTPKSIHREKDTAEERSRTVHQGGGGEGGRAGRP